MKVQKPITGTAEWVEAILKETEFKISNEYRGADIPCLMYKLPGSADWKLFALPRCHDVFMRGWDEGLWPSKSSEHLLVISPETEQVSEGMFPYLNREAAAIVEDFIEKKADEFANIVI